MKVRFKLLMLCLMLVVPTIIFAQDDPTAIDFDNPSSVITWLMPIITLGVTWLVKKISPFITGTVTLIVVPLLSSGIAYLASVLGAGGSWFELFVAGLGSVFLNQLYRSITGNN